MFTTVRRATLAVLGAGCLLASLVAPASAQPIALATVVSENPVNYTPQVAISTAFSHPAVYALRQVGSTMYAGGAFDTVTSGAGTATRQHLMGFDATTGTLTNLSIPIDGDVWAIEPSADGQSLYVGGFFNNINGVARNGIAKINATTGVVDQTFASSAVAGPVTEIRLVNGRLLVSGRFSKRLLALNPATGADTGYINVPITGQVASNAGPTRVYRFTVNPAGTRLVGIGNFTQVGTASRQRAFMLDLGATSATVDPWYYQPLDNACAATKIPEQIRDVDFSSDGSFFVFFASGYIPKAGGLGRDICDAAARFETNVTNPTLPTWINYTGGDTMWSGAVTGNTVYAQGHFRALDNAGGTQGCDGKNPACQPRQGIGAINATTGKALAWNPGKTRAVGGKDLLVTSAGLWVGSDGALFNGEHHYGIAFCPLP